MFNSKKMLFRGISAITGGFIASKLFGSESHISSIRFESQGQLDYDNFFRRVKKIDDYTGSISKVKKPLKIDSFRRCRLLQRTRDLYSQDPSGGGGN